MSPKPIPAAALAIAAFAVLSAAPPRDLATRVEKLQARVDRIESIRAIKRLQYAYGHYVELGLWNDFADLFTDDAITNYQSGVLGKDAIRKLFFDQVGQGKLGLAEGRIYPHILFQPVITLAPDGRAAKGRWRILAMLGGLGGTATWYSGVYENEYLLENGTWKISVIHSEPKVTAAYSATGWKDSGTHVPLHFTASNIGVRTPGAVNRARPSSLTVLADQTGQLARRATALNDQSAVTNLLNTYGYAVDRKLWDQAAALFARDGTLELGMQGVYVGKASIRYALDRLLRERTLDDHVYLQTIVSVAPGGNAANARGVELIFSSASGAAELSEGTFENTFVKQDGIWKIQSVHFYPRMIVDAAQGWAKGAKPAPGASKDLPPDRPPSASYEIYPKFSIAPFHFDNPVTRKPPQYPAGVPTAARLVTVNPRTHTKPAVRSVKALESELANLKRSITAAEAWDATEDLIGSLGYYLDESPGEAAGLFAKGSRHEAHDLASDGKTFVNQILQPVIDVAPDAQSVKVRARLLNLSGTSGGAGYWTAGTFEGQIVLEQGQWRFQSAHDSATWSARYPGGWSKP